MIAASPLLAGLECHVLMLGQDSPENQTALQWARERLTEAGFKPVLKLLPGNLDEMAGAYCVAEDIHLLAMGAYGHSRIRQFFVGSNTSLMLNRMKVPLLLLR
jgi:nucleotide-binding universal stress UspA family protein